MHVPSHITLTATKLLDVWSELDAKKMLGVSRAASNLNENCESFTFKQKVTQNACEIAALCKQDACFASKLVGMGQDMIHYVGMV